MYGHNHHQHQQQGAILDNSNGQKVPGASSDVGALEERWNQHHWRWRLLVEPGGESVAHVERLLLACLLIAVQNSRNLHDDNNSPTRAGVVPLKAKAWNPEAFVPFGSLLEP